MLAGLVQNPDSNNPVRNPSAAIDRRDVVVNRMLELKLITANQAKSAKKVTFNRNQVKPTRNGCQGTKFPLLCDYVYRTLKTLPSLGKTTVERDNLIKRGGLTIQTALDPKIQRLAEKRVAGVVGAKDPLISTMNMIQPGTGLIVAMAQNRTEMGSKKGQTYINYSVGAGAMGGGRGFQAGSTFKSFTMAAALEKGIPISKKFNAKSPYNFTGKTFQSCQGQEQIGRYIVKNSVGHSKTIGMIEAAEFSVNTYFIQLELAAGMCRVTKMTKKAGVELGDPGVDLVEEYNQYPSFTLGTANVTPLSMAEGYATFAARGIHCDPIVISKVTSRSGKSLEVPDGNCKRVMSKGVADGVSKVLKSVMDSGTGTRAKIFNGHEMAGKTGTTESNRAVWFAGYTPEIAGVAMIAVEGDNKYWKGKRKSVKGYTVPSTRVYLEGSGSGDSGSKIWKPVMESYLRNVPKTRFSQPPSAILRGKKVQVPSLYGLSYDAAKKKLEKAGFTVETAYVFSDRPKGTVLGWSPSPGSTTQQYGTIYWNLSKGKDPEVVKEEKRKKREEKKQAEEAKKRREEQKKPR